MDDETFSRDIERALALSVESAAEDERKRLINLEREIFKSHSSPNFAKLQSTTGPAAVIAGTKSSRSSRPPAPLPAPSRSSDPFDTSWQPMRSLSPVADPVTARPRPRPSSGSRAISPLTLSSRRSGFIEASPKCTESLQSPTRTSSNPFRNLLERSSPPTILSGSTELKNGPSVAIKKDSFDLTSWESFCEHPTSTSNSPFSSTNPFLVTPPDDAMRARSSSFDELLQVQERPRSDSATDSLIVLSPLTNEKLMKHYKIDVKRHYGVSEAPQASHSSRTSTAVHSFSLPQTSAWSTLPSNLAEPARRMETVRESIAVSRQRYDAGKVVDDIFSNAASPEEMPSSRISLLPAPAKPILPARRISVQKVSAPVDLLDLNKDVKPPDISSIRLFDPLYSPPNAVTHKSFDDQFTDYSDRLSTKPSVKAQALSPGSAEQDWVLLQDPFSFEELNMALMTSSKIKGKDMIVEEDNGELAEIATPLEASAKAPPRPAKPQRLSGEYARILKISNMDSADEFTSFSVMVARLKSEYTYDDSFTNMGILFSPTTDVPKMDCFTVQITVFTSMANEPVVFTVDVNTSVEIIIWTVLSNMNTNLQELSIDDYILKLFGLSEYLINDSSLSDYTYVHNCLKLDEPIRFSLHEVATLDKPFARKPGDDDEPIYMIKDELHGDKSHKVLPRDLKILYDTYNVMAEKVLAASVEKGLRDLSLTCLLQSIKAITSVLLGAETINLKRGVKHLVAVINEASETVNHTAGRIVELMSDFQEAMDDLRSCVRNLITMYCATFHVNFNPTPACRPPPRDVRKITDSGESLIINVNSVHRLPVSIRSLYDQFKVIVSLYYGGAKLCDHVITNVFSTTEHKGEEDIYFEQWLEMDYPLCVLPLETRLMFTLCASSSTPSANNSVNAPREWTNIGWIAPTLFDFRRYIVQGDLLLSLWPGKPNPTGATGSNIWQPNTILLQVNLPDFGHDLYFPLPIHVEPRPREERTLEQMPDQDLIELKSILEKDDRELDKEDAEFLWSKRKHLCNMAEVFPKVLLSAPDYSFSGVHLLQEVLDMWCPLTPLEAMRLLLPDFPNQQVRAAAVHCLKNMCSDEMCDYLPQLVQCLKFEAHHDSPLMRLLLERAITSVRLAQQLYWLTKEAAFQPAYRERFKLLFGGLVSVIGKSLREEVEREELLVKHCNTLADQIKETKADKEKVMSKEIIQISEFLKHGTVRLPTNPGQEVKGLDLKLCTYFNSFTVPLKLVFRSVEEGAPNHCLMYKVGDDLRQDMIVMQLIRIIDKLWKQNDLDLKIVTFTCLPTGDKRGMIELITDCETLRKIQTQSGVTGSFKDQPLANWLQKHNPTQLDYSRAVENFTLSCAGYCVATYILGIGDRHNDNIMVKRTGHIFHIDFSKFLGEAQMFGNIKRDRTPFVLTPDMAYVINEGDKPSQKFQDFIDLCCEAYNVLRQNTTHILTLLKMMTESGVQGISKEALGYVYNALKPKQSKSEATASFTRMIEESLQSRFVQLNFFMHNLAQLKFSSHSDGGLLSFMPSVYSLATDGRIVNVEIFHYQKRYQPEKHYVYIIKVHRENQRDASFVYRRYSEFQEFYQKLVALFPSANLPKLPGSVLLGRTHVQKVAERRKLELESFLRQLLMQAKEIAEHDLIYTFFHTMLRDEKEILPAHSSYSFKDTATTKPSSRTIGGEIKLSLVYKAHALHIMVMHIKGLANETGDRPNPYVKMYLLPDPIKTTKRKTKAVSSSFHPTYNAMFLYKMPLGELKQRTLQVTVWSADMTGNEFLGAVHLYLYTMDLTKEHVAWYKITALHKMTM